MPIYLIKTELSTDEDNHASTTYYVDAPSEDLACTALMVEREAASEALQIVEQLQPGDANAVRYEGIWIRRASKIG